MQLWGSSIDASKAKLWQIPKDQFDDEELPLSTSTLAPTHTQQSASKIAATTTSMKSYVKPTVHLPDDHAEAPGESHLPFETVTASPSAPPTLKIDTTVDQVATKPAPLVEIDEDEIYNDGSGGYLAGMKGLLLNSTWLFVAAGTVIIFAGGATAFFWMRKRKMIRMARGNGYDFAPMSDEEDISMRDIEPGGRGKGGGPRTRDLYDAFALGDEELSGEDYDDDDELEEKSKIEGKVSYSDDAVRFFIFLNTFIS